MVFHRHRCRGVPGSELVGRRAGYHALPPADADGNNIFVVLDSAGGNILCGERARSRKGRTGRGFYYLLSRRSIARPPRREPRSTPPPPSSSPPRFHRPGISAPTSNASRDASSRARISSCADRVPQPPLEARSPTPSCSESRQLRSRASACRRERWLRISSLQAHSHRAPTAAAARCCARRRCLGGACPERQAHASKGALHAVALALAERFGGSLQVHVAAAEGQRHAVVACIVVELVTVVVTPRREEGVAIADEAQRGDRLLKRGASSTSPWVMVVSPVQNGVSVGCRIGLTQRLELVDRCERHRID